MSDSEQTLAEMEELALRCSLALGKPVVVVGFTSSGEATVYDAETVEDDELELSEVARINVTPTPPPDNAACATSGDSVTLAARRETL